MSEGESEMNLILFIVCSLAVLFGGLWLMSHAESPDDS